MVGGGGGGGGAGGVSGSHPMLDHSPVSRTQQVPVAEIIKKLDFATRENLRLRQAVEENNNFLEQRLKDLSRLRVFFLYTVN